MTGTTGRNTIAGVNRVLSVTLASAIVRGAGDWMGDGSWGRNPAFAGMTVRRRVAIFIAMTVVAFGMTFVEKLSTHGD